MLMATFQASLKTLSTTPGTLVELVGRMNRYACTNSQNGRRFTTAFIAEYDPATRLLTYVNAGHNNPILRRNTGVDGAAGSRWRAAGHHGRGALRVRDGDAADWRLAGHFHRRRG